MRQRQRRSSASSGWSSSEGSSGGRGQELYWRRASIPHLFSSIYSIQFLLILFPCFFFFLSPSLSLIPSLCTCVLCFSLVFLTVPVLFPFLDPSPTLVSPLIFLNSSDHRHLPTLHSRPRSPTVPAFSVYVCFCDCVPGRFLRFPLRHPQALQVFPQPALTPISVPQSRPPVILTTVARLPEHNPILLRLQPGRQPLLSPLLFEPSTLRNDL